MFNNQHKINRLLIYDFGMYLYNTDGTFYIRTNNEPLFVYLGPSELFINGVRILYKGKIKVCDYSYVGCAKIVEE